MASFADELKSAREQRGLSLESLSAETKVNSRHFFALEQGNYRELPGGVFRRGIVRAYLKAVGLEEEAWLPRFQQSFADWQRATGIPPEVNGEAWAVFAENVKRNRAPAATGTGIRWVGVLALLLVLLAAAWATWHFILHDRLPR